MNSAALPSTIRSAVLIVARKVLRSAGLDRLPESTSETCRVIGASRSQTHEMVERVEEALDSLHRHPGRPTLEPAQGVVAEDLLRKMRDFLMDHPGCVEKSGSRRVYAEAYFDFVTSQLIPGGAGHSLTQEQAADLFAVPLGTLKDWLARPRPPSPGTAETPSHDDEAARESSIAGLSSTHPLIATILQKYPSWKGTFSGFRRHLKKQWKVPYGRTFIATILDAAGLIKPKRRDRERRPWSKDAFRKLFPGAQWIGDGKSVVVEWLGESMVFNLEALIDVSSNAIVGAQVTNTEDEQAVLSAYFQAKAATNSQPLAVTLDRKPSNHTDRVSAAITPAELLATIKARPTAKAPIEGSFGLFSQTAPPFVVSGDSPREQARSALKLYIQVWCWTRNHRPRKKLGGRTPVAAYQDSCPTKEQIAEAKSWFAALRLREEQCRQTLEAKADPVRRALLEEALLEFGIADPDNRLTLRLAASYCQEAIVRAIATYRTKVRLGTLPRDKDSGSYLAGIIRRIHGDLEDALYAELLLDARLRHHELSLRSLEREAARVKEEHPDEHGTDRPRAFLARALEAAPLVDFRFWLRQLQESARALPPMLARALYGRLSKHISCAYKTRRDRRRELIGALSEAALVAG